MSEFFDKAAIAAMQGLIAKTGVNGVNATDMARDAVDIAMAMLDERDKVISYLNKQAMLKQRRQFSRRDSEGDK